jgi:hypothetical protein
MQVGLKTRSERGLSPLGIALAALLAAAASFALGQLFTASAWACHIPGKPDTIGCDGEPGEPPTVSLTKPVMDFWNDTHWNDTVDLEASASDDGVVQGVEFLIGGSAVGTDATAPYTHSLDTTSMPDGETTVSMRAIDDGGQSTTSDPVTIQIDNTDPAITISDWITRPTRGGGGQLAVLGRVQISDAGFLYGNDHCFFDGDPSTGESCLGFGVRLEEDNTYVLSRDDFADGEHTITITAFDAAGNVGTATRSFTFDRTPPETTITSGPAEGSSTVSSSASFGLSANEQVAEFACRLFPAANGEPNWESCSGPGATHTRSGLAPGTYRFEAIAIDQAGNVDPSPVARTFTLAAPPSGGTDTGSPGTGSNPDPGPASGGGDQPGVQVPPPPAAPANDKPGKCSKLKGKKRAACVKKACGKLKGAKKKACVAKVTHKPQARRS